MKIECDKCSAKYSIADEKVRGKTFKIRCKKCSNVIIVRDKGVIAAEAGSAGALEQVGPGWHLAINGETVGPMPEDEVRQRFAAGEIDKDTAVWQEGFDDWLPLGDVDAFTDLPERGSEDPFAASANQDDYAASVGRSMGVGAAAAVAATGTDGYSEPQSPRVSKLTGQRNENSVLFSLDSLQAIATGGGGAAAAPRAAAPIAARTTANPSKGLATSAPSSEGSGLIDIRALGAMVGSEHAAPTAAAAPQRAADDNALPSFGGAGFGGLAATPLVPQPAPVEAAAAAALAAALPQPRSNAPLYIMMIILILAVLGLAGFILMRDQEPRVVKEEVPATAPSVTDKDKDEDKDKDDDEDKDKDDEGDKDKDDKDKDDEGDKAAAEADSDGSDVAAEDKDKPGTKPRSKSSSKSSSSSSKKPSSSSSSSSSSASSSTPTPAAKDDDIPIECVLDPKSCKNGKPKAPSSSSSSSTTPKADPSLPASLTQPEVRNGINPHKAAAKTCGSKHGAKAGEKVTVKLSISGSSGTVSSASAMGKHAGTPLGNCVAAALKKATFKKFQKTSIGVQYPVTL
jgi:predicted Zn finger-like uncharacterized protein